MDTLKYKVIVAHPEQQHSYRLASALKKNNMLFKYITTVYDKESSLLMKLVKRVISKDNLKRANKRKNPDLSEIDVIQFYEIRGYINILLNRIDKKKKIYNYWRKRTADKFGRKVANYAIKNNIDAVIMYDLNAEECFKTLKQKAPHIKRILDTSAANRVFMRSIYEQDLILSPEYSDLLKLEIDYLSDEDKLKHHKTEIETSQFFLAGSSFVKKSIMYSGIAEDKINICPYGVDINLFKYTARKAKKDNEVLEFVYVGGTKQLKGISYLLTAFDEIDHTKAKLTIVGSYNLPESIIDKYKQKVNFTGNILQSEVAELLTGKDVMIFPSLGEGMSLSVLEAMSSGLMVITSVNSGTNDLITDGINGLIIPIQDKNAIIEKVEWCINNRTKLPEMGYYARKTAEAHTWNTYENEIKSALLSILSSNIMT